MSRFGVLDFDKHPVAAAGTRWFGAVRIFRKRRNSRVSYLHCTDKHNATVSRQELSPHQVRFLRQWFEWREAELVKAGLLDAAEREAKL